MGRAPSEKHPIRGQAEATGNFDDPAVGNAALAARLADRLGRYPQKLGQLGVAAHARALQQAIQNFGRVLFVHGGILKKETIKVNQQLIFWRGME